VWPLPIVQLQISVNSSPRFTAVAISFQIYLLVLHTPPQSLHKYVVQVSALAIHADLDPPLQQQAAEGCSIHVKRLDRVSGWASGWLSRLPEQHIASGIG